MQNAESANHPTDAGLCATCLHCRVIRARRSSFYMCERSFTDARFPRYPRLPVLQCIGYTPSVPRVPIESD